MKSFISAFILLALYSSALNAQTAHAGATIPIGNGFNGPYGVAVDSHGNVFVADQGANNLPGVVYEIVAVNGVVSANSQVNVIGSGFNSPTGVAVDGYGNVFVADSGTNQVDEIVAVNGVVSANSQVNAVGSNFSIPFAVVVDAHGNVFVSDYGSNQIKEIVAVNGLVSSASQVNIIGSSGNFNRQNGLAMDASGNIFVADTNNSQIKEIVAVNGVVSDASQVIAVGGAFYHPSGVAVDAYGNVFVADPPNPAGGVQEIVAVNGAVSSTSTVVTVGAGSSAAQGVALDASGNVFVASANAADVLEILSGTQKFPTTAVGRTSAPLTVYFTFDSAGSLAATPYVVLTQGAQNLDFQAAATQPANACLAGNSHNAGDICAVNVTFVPTSPGQRMGAVQLMGSGGTPIATANLQGTGIGPQLIFPSNSAVTTLPKGSGFHLPAEVAVDGNGNVFVAGSGDGSVREIAAVNGTIPANASVYNVGNFVFLSPSGVAVDGSGNVFVADNSNSHNVYEIVAVNGSVSSSSSVIAVGSGFLDPYGVAVDGSGNVFVADTLNNAVKEVVAVNGLLSTSSSVITLGSGFKKPTGIAVDASGNVFVADNGNNAVKEIVAVNGVVSSSSSVLTLGSGFSNPSGVAVDGSGNVFVADYKNDAVKEIVAVNGAVTSGSSVLTLGSGFALPFGVALDASGNIFVGDTGNNAIKEIDRVDPPSLTFAQTNVNSTSSDSPQTVTVQNSGNANLTGTLSVGTNFTQVAGSGTPADCSASFSLTPSQECNLSISFKPTISGPVTGSASFTDNAPASPQSISLSGTGVALTQTIQNFGTISTQTVGTPLTLTATATSGLAVSYQSSTPTVCTVSGSSVAFVSPGQCSITASQNGNNVYSAAQSITQQFAVNPNVPTISNLQAVSVGGSSELITWSTDQPSSSQVTYGTTTTPLDGNLVTFHSVTLTGLAQNTAYNYSVSSTNSTNGTATSPSGSFTTKPYVGYVAFWGVNNSGVTISWSTDFAATTFVAYGTSTALGQTSPVQSALSNGHGVVLTGLNPGTTYYFRAESTDGNGHTGASTLYTFTTTGQPASPAPVISNVSVTNITTTGATITWTTDQAATTQVNYGTSTSYGSSSSLNSNLVTSHSVTLTGLTPGTLYDYDVVSTNSSGTSSGMSTNYTFTTTAIIGTPPVISNIQTSVTSTTATITWTTDQAANSAISGTVSKSPDSNYVTSHSVTLTGLTPGTLYNFSVVSTNAGGLTTTSPASTFTTTAANATAPFVGYVAFWGVNNSGVTISWSTDLAANTQLNFGTTPSLGTLTPLQATLTNSHGVVLTGLASGTTYYFVAQSTGANGATGYSTTYSFTTTGSPSAPAPAISNIQTSVTSTTATITWTTDEAASSQVNYGVTTTYSASSTLNTNLSTTHSVTLTGLMPGTIYDFDVMSANINGTSSTSSNSTFQTTGSAPGPMISSVAASSITSGSALITWTTDQASTSVVNYGQTVSSATLVTSHSVALSGLTPNTQYSFTVTSVNAASVSTTSSSYTFTTSAASAAGPVISYVAYWGITSSGITISWSTNVPSNTSVAYGTTNALTSVTPVQSALSNSHGVTLTGLQPGTLYYFQAQSADVNGNTGTSTVYSFTTLAGGTPVISNVLVTPGSGNTASISWTTSVPTYSYVQYGPSSGNYNRYSPQSSLTASPNVSLGFVPSGAIYYQLVSTDANGDQVVSPEAMFVEP